MVQVIVGAIIAILITILVEWVRKPRLSISLLPPESGDRTYEGRPARTARFLYMTLQNKQLPWPLKWMLRGTALQCHGSVKFFNSDGGQLFISEMEVRWSNTPEPTPSVLQMDDRQYPIWNPFSFVSRVDISPGEGEKFDVVARFDNEENCYGWSNENYLRGWRNPDRILRPGRYLALISFVSAGEKYTGLYRIINDVPQRDFRLEKATPEDWQRINI